MTPLDLADKFWAGAPADTTHPVVVSLVQGFFERRDPELPPMRTADLAEALWPAAQAGEHMAARKRFVDLLLKLGKTTLAHYATRSSRPVGRFMGRPKFPLFWHPAAAHPDGPGGTGPTNCPTCGKPL